MDLNASAMAIASALSQRTFPEKEFKRLDLLRGLPLNSTEPRHISRRGEAANNLSQALTNS